MPNALSVELRSSITSNPPVCVYVMGPMRYKQARTKIPYMVKCQMDRNPQVLEIQFTRLARTVHHLEIDEDACQPCDCLVCDVYESDILI